MGVNLKEKPWIEGRQSSCMSPSLRKGLLWKKDFVPRAIFAFLFFWVEIYIYLQKMCDLGSISQAKPI